MVSPYFLQLFRRTHVTLSSGMVDHNHERHAQAEIQRAARETADYMEGKVEAVAEEDGYILLPSGQLVPTWEVADMDPNTRREQIIEHYQDGANALLTGAEFFPHPYVSVPASVVRSTVDVLSGQITPGEAAAHVGRLVITGPIGKVVRTVPIKPLPTTKPSVNLGKDAAPTTSLREGGGGSSSAGPSRPTPKAEKPTTPTSQKQEQPQLLPGEGRVDTYGELSKMKRGDNLTPHHIPQNSYMKSKGVSADEGIAILMEHPFPGTGGRHRATATYGRKPDLTRNPRDILAHDVQDARKIYRKDGLYTPGIRRGLQEVVEQNKTRYPELFKKGDQ